MPTLPPYIALKQAKNYMKPVQKGDPDAAATAFHAVKRSFV